MADRKQNPSVATAVEEPPVSFPPPTFYAELAANLVNALDQFLAAMPPLDALTVSEKFIKRKRRVPAPFVADAVSAILTDSELQNVRTLNAAQAVDDQLCLEAFRPLVRRVKGADKALRLMVQAREARAAANAQQIYAVAKAFTSDREATSLGVHVGNMKRSLRGTARRQRPIEPETPATPGKEETTSTKSPQ
jgi:hypothetical protein